MEDSQGQQTGTKRTRGESTAEQPECTKIAGLEQVLACLQSKNDTQRFVGLTLLMKSLERIQGDSELVNRCWRAIPSTFLTGLLRAKAIHSSKDAGKQEEAQIKFQLGLDVLHTFFSLLNLKWVFPSSMDEEEQRVWKRRIVVLLKEVPVSPESTKVELLQVLVSISTYVTGAQLLYSIWKDNWDLVLNDMSQQPLVLEMVSRMFSALSYSDSDITGIAAESLFPELDRVLSRITKELGPAATSTPDLFNWFSQLVRSKNYQKEDEDDCFMEKDTFDWLEQLVQLMGTAVMRPRSISSGVQASVVELAKEILDKFPQSMHVLFNPTMEPPSGGPNPTSFTIISSVLIDVRCTIPSLLEILHKPEYKDTSTRLSTSYDLVFKYLDFLLKAEDDAENGRLKKGRVPQRLPYNLLLILHDDVAQAMRLTVESLRDRYDAAINHDTDLRDMTTDPVIVSQVGALGFWLQEDDSASADDLLEVLLNLCTCTKDPDLFAETVVTMVAERGDLRRAARALIEDLPGLQEAAKTILKEGAVEPAAVVAEDDDDDEDEEEDEDEDDGLYDLR